MNILLISEHYFPKIGGTVSYVENTAINLAKHNDINVFLLIPSHGKLGEIEKVNSPESKLTLLKLGVSQGSQLIFDKQERDYLCMWISNNIFELTQQYQIQIIHLLYGLFIANILDTKFLKSKGIKTVHTVHNIPPFECSNSWKNDKPYYFLKDEIRKIGVRIINKKRIKKNKFDYYITPSNFVKNELSKYVDISKIHVIGHGGAEYIQPNEEKSNKTNTINILTVGGIVPHKNQHLIPEIADYLLKNEIDFVWNIVGPVRNKRYADSLKKNIDKCKLKDAVFINENVNNEQLNSFYNSATIYIHLSSEEGFCMSVLDAISHNVPVLGTPAGAIPEMLEKIEGTLIETHLPSLKLIIAHYLKIINYIKIDEELLASFKKDHTWNNAVKQLITLYYD